MRDTQPVPLVVPRNFRLICELFGVPVAAFIQLFLDHYSFMDLHLKDNSSYNLATRGISFVNHLVKTEKTPSLMLDKSERDLGVKLTQRQVKIAVNRNYSIAERRNKGRVITGQLYDLFAKKVMLKDTLYLDENTCFKLSKDLLLTCILNNIHPARCINTLMEQVSIPNYLATMHLDRGTYNPILGFILRVQDGYGNIIDWEYRHTAAFQQFIMELQELNKRYFFYRSLDRRIAIYHTWLDDFLENRNKDL
ncbi:hypothetical protein HX021_12115 [Sphingobacterium sp. N143]|uniref:hypothetical protein n=1 Tax=Sphingobacterium sp. N143 TaxID=2746727 RepID=UPI00257795FD|nr:hypothetical protein [Sphingobacterium sp. N143]MDM1295027.1 hypothetical protein [Sphingobacterium sp. N143]